MAELKEGQQIIFVHPHDGAIHAGFATEMNVCFQHKYGKATMPQRWIKAWCDAEAAFNAWKLQNARSGNFEWSQPEAGPTVEP